MHTHGAAFTELPPYRAMLVVDLKDFSGTPGAEQARIGALIPELLRDTFQRIGHRHLWDEGRFPDHTGDGYAIGLPPEVLPLLLDHFLGGLQDELEYRHRLRGGTPLRMRVSLSVGPLTDFGREGVRDGQGGARIETHRLLDSVPVRELLTRSNPEITLVAAVISARVYEDVVAAGYSSLDSSQFVPAPVQVKTYEGTAYLHVPRPSGGLLTSGFTPAEPALAAPAPAEEEPKPRPGSWIGDVKHNKGTTVVGNQGPVQTGNGQQVVDAEVHGGIRQRRRRQK